MPSPVRLAFALLLLLGGISAAPAAQIPHYQGPVSADGASYVVGDETIHLSRATTEAAIRFKTDLTDDQIVQTVRDACADPAVSLLAHLAASDDLILLHVTDSRQVETTMRTDADVDFVTPVYLGSDNGRVIPTGDLLIGIAPEAITDDFRAALRERGLEFIERIDYLPACRVRPIDLPRANVFDAALSAATIPDVRSAEPDFRMEIFIEPPDWPGGGQPLILPAEWQGVIPTAADSPLTTDASPPTLTLDGPHRITTDRPLLKLTGTTTGNVTNLLYRPGPKGRFRPAPAGPTWALKLRLKPGKNLLTLMAQGPGGTSLPVRVVITRN
jgi:hypothetical protein